MAIDVTPAPDATEPEPPPPPTPPVEGKRSRFQLPSAYTILFALIVITALTRADQGLQMILHRSAQSARASAFYCYVSGGLSAAAAVVAWFMLPSPFLILFTGACAVVLIASGIWYGRGAKRQSTDSP